MAAAAAYAQRGWRVIQLHGVSDIGTCTCGKQKCPSAGKHPIDTSWQNTPAMSVADIYEAWGARPWANLGVATGSPSGFFVLDIDPDHGGMATMAALVEKHGRPPATLTQRTGSGGWHYFFAMPADFDVRNTQQAAKKFGGPGLDVRGTGGQIVIAPSVSGKGPYTLLDAPIAPAPEWLLALLRPKTRQQTPEPAPAPAAPPAPPDDRETARLTAYAKRAIELELGRLVECREKGWEGPPWNATTYSVACNLLEIANADWTDLTPDTVEALMLTWAPQDDGFGEEAIRKCLWSARQTVGDKARQQPPPPANRGVDLFAPFGGNRAPGAPYAAAPHPRSVIRTWDDLGNAARIVDHLGDRLRYIATDKTWSVYDGRRWARDDSNGAVSLIQQVMANLEVLEAGLYDDEKIVDEKKGLTMRGLFVVWAGQQRMAARVDAAEKMARAHPSLQARPTDFDRDPMLLNCLNGVVDLRAGALVAHNPNLMLSQLAGVHFDPNARAPQWEAFLNRVMPDPLEQGYLRRAAGYSITGDIGEAAMFIHTGVGANGKSQWLIAMQLVLGDYNQIVPRTTMLVKSGDSIPTDVARMVGKRFLQSSETAAGKRLDEETVKSLTGGEANVARHLYGKEFEFTPTGKIHYVTNHLPRLTDAESIWRRLHLFSWRVVIPKDQQVKNLGRLLARDEGPGILNWLVAGCLEWQQFGLGQPASAYNDLVRYRTESDELGEFLTDYIRPTSGGRASMRVIYAAYVQWVSLSGLGNKALSRQTLSMAMKERGYEPYRTSGDRGFLGVSVIPPMSVYADDGLVGKGA